MCTRQRPHMKTPQREQLATAALPGGWAQATAPSGPASATLCTTMRTMGGENGTASKRRGQATQRCSPPAISSTKSGALQWGQAGPVSARALTATRPLGREGGSGGSGSSASSVPVDDAGARGHVVDAGTLLAEGGQ